MSWDGWQVLDATFIEIFKGKVRIQCCRGAFGNFQSHPDLCSGPLLVCGNTRSSVNVMCKDAAFYRLVVSECVFSFFF